MEQLYAQPPRSGALRIAYGPGELQCGELWLPAGDGDCRVVLMVHGGGWQTDIAKCSIMQWIARAADTPGLSSTSLLRQTSSAKSRASAVPSTARCWARILLTTSPGVARGDRCGLEGRSQRPAAPCSAKRRCHL